MIHKRHRLRLKKQVIIAVPVAFLITTVITLLIAFSSQTFTSEIKATQVMDALASEEINENYTNKYITDFNNQLEIRKKDNTVIFYAEQFKINIDKALELVHNYTNNYTAEDYNQNYVIGPDFIKEREGSFPSEEAGIAFFIKDLYVWPQNYGCTIEEIRTSSEIDIDRNIVDGKIYLDNGLTYEQYMGKLADMYGLDKTLTLAVSYHETGVLTSGLFTLSNNVGGQRGMNGWMSFTTLEAGMLTHVLSVRSIVKMYNIDMNSETAINELSSVYVNGIYGNVAYDWVNKVSYFMQSIENQDLFLTE